MKDISLKWNGGKAFLLSFLLLLVLPGFSKNKEHFRIYEETGRVVWELSEELLGREWFLINQVVAVDARYSGQAGSVIGDPVILELREKEDGSMALIRKVSVSAQAGSNMVAKPKAPHEWVSFPCERDRNTLRMDITDWVTESSGIVEGRLREGTLKLYAHEDSQEMAGWRDGGVHKSALVSSCIFLLPKQPIRMRYEDPRLGYFRSKHVIVTDSTAEEEEAYCISRWRLEPRDEDVKKYRKGILVEPKEPIVFHVDPLTPRKWVPYIEEAILSWNEAFERAGFKNAIRAVVADTGDSTWTLESCKGAIIYKLNEEENAFGNRYADPRTGEILHARVQWGHCLVDWLRENYIVQAGANDPTVFTEGISDEWLGKLLAVIVSHEIGHTLGLLHNMGASSVVPVEKLRDNAWLTEHGHSASIMDYSRFNYVAQPEDGVDRRNLIPRIGVYDRWAIEWGYRLFPEFKTLEEEHAYLTDWITREQSKWGYWYGDQSINNDPRIQSEDVGDDLVMANTYGMENLKWVLEQMDAWASDEDGGYGTYQRYYNRVASFVDRGVPVGQYNYYLKQIVTIVGGSYVERDAKGKETNRNVEKEYQQRAMEFLDQYAFHTPGWLLEPMLKGKVNQNPLEFTEQLYTGVFAFLLPKITGLAERKSPQDYTLEDFWTDLDEMVWGDVLAGRMPGVYRQNLQQVFVRQLQTFGSRGGPAAVKLGNVYLKRLRDKVKKAQPQEGTSAMILPWANPDEFRVYRDEWVRKLDRMLK